MGPRVAALAALLLAGSALTACGSDEAAGPQVLRVGEDYDTIQAAVDDARPGDMVLIEAGTYAEEVLVETDRLVLRGVDRQGVVLDGEDSLANGIEVQADQVAVENLTVRRYTVNGVIFGGGYDEDQPDNGPRGWRASYVTVSNNGLYGLYAFGTGPGQFDHNYASGHPDSGIYVGQCRDCGAVVVDNVMERNAIGYENTNASGIVLARNVIRRNRVGVAISSADTEYLAPQAGGAIVANLIVDNAEAEAPATQGAFGVGIAIAGGTENEVRRNQIDGHPGAGVVLIDQDGFAPERNEVVDNALAGNGVDLGFVTEGGGAPDASDNCFAGNEGSTSTPPDLEALLPCDATAGSVPAASLALPEPPDPFDHREVAAPPAQPSMPGDLERWSAPPLEPPALDLDELEVPSGS